MTKTCLKCNKEYDDTHNFCQTCGGELSEVSTEKTNEKGFFNKVIDKGTELKKRNDAHNQEKREKYAEKRRKKEKKKHAKKMTNRSTTEKKYDFFFEDKAEQFKEDAKKADKVYKAYITSGISRIEKVNGRFLASQLIKLDILNEQNNQIIEQNNEIIKLLKEIAKK